MQMEMRFEGGDPTRPRRLKRAAGAAPRTGEAERQSALCLDAASNAGPEEGDPAETGASEPPATSSARAERGQRGYLTGLAAEESVARHYTRSGRVIEARRWRGPGGEIDLILREGRRLVFVEVKSSRSFDAAIAHLTRRQIDRICRSAEAYCGAAPEGLLTEMRFDLALVDGRGAVRVIENAFGAG